VNRLKRAGELLVLFVVFPFAVMIGISLVYAVSAVGLAAYVGALLAVWLLFAYVVPLGSGIMAPDEIWTAIRSRRRRANYFEGESLADDRTLWIPWKRGED
jgi:hypothetical protein